MSPLLAAGLPALLETLGGLFKRVPNVAAQTAATALEGVSNAIKNGQVSPEQLQEINRHYEELQKLESAERQTAYTQVNESLRAEVASSDPYVRRMRPTFGYMIAVTWAAQMLAIAYVIIVDTESAGIVIDAMENLGTIWAVGLSVLGIYVYKRSEEKRG
ncbi:MAG: ribokinase [Alphaproteobacteria bacterium]|nr:ribokinase [Alphaproteobacteria bacterium]